MVIEKKDATEAESAAHFRGGCDQTQNATTHSAQIQRTVSSRRIAMLVIWKRRVSASFQYILWTSVPTH
jgi:hypothetical protein